MKYTKYTKEGIRNVVNKEFESQIKDLILFEHKNNIRLPAYLIELNYKKEINYDIWVNILSKNLTFYGYGIKNLIVIYDDGSFDNLTLNYPYDDFKKLNLKERRQIKKIINLYKNNTPFLYTNTFSFYIILERLKF
ncbi:MAG: hypothetical protein HFJ37_03815 [Clostridia bacterium]|nr:hypothetical protein [Clostridia bacterium]